MPELNLLPELLNDSSCKGYWRLEDVTAAKGGYTLTNNNTVTFTSAKYGNGANLGTSNTNKDLSVSNDLGITNGACSISTWVKLTTEIGSGFYYFVVKEDGGSGVSYQIRYNYNGGTRQVEFGRSKYNIGTQLVSTPITLGASIFHHLVVTYDGTNVKGYLDGTYINQAAASGDGDVAPGDGVYIGSIRSLASYASAVIDDVAIFSRALTAAEVLSLYNNKGGALFFAQY